MKARIYDTTDGKKIAILNDHIVTESGNFKGVCVSAVLSYFGITPDQYKYTWSKKVGNNYHNILRRFGYSVRSRNSVFSKAKTVSQIKKAIKKYADIYDNVSYMVVVKNHVLLLNSNGQTVVDTSPRKMDRRKVLKVSAVFINKLA